MERASALRAFYDGKMVLDATTVGLLLPRNAAGFPNANDARAYPDDQLFFAGGGWPGGSFIWPWNGHGFRALRVSLLR